MATDEWPEAKAALLRSLVVAEGRSYADAGRVLGVSRNAALGKARRMGLVVPPGNADGRAGAAELEAARQRAVEREMPAPPPRPVAPLPIPLPRTCQWPMWPNGASCMSLPDRKRFCGAPTVPGRPYCEAHMRVALVQPKEDEADG